LSLFPPEPVRSPWRCLADADGHGGETGQLLGPNEHGEIIMNALMTVSKPAQPCAMVPTM